MKVLGVVFPGAVLDGISPFWDKKCDDPDRYYCKLRRMRR